MGFVPFRLAKFKVLRDVHVEMSGLKMSIVESMNVVQAQHSGAQRGRSGGKDLVIIIRALLCLCD